MVGATSSEGGLIDLVITGPQAGNEMGVFFGRKVENGGCFFVKK